MGGLARRRLGRTGLEVSVLGFGGAPLGGFRATVDEEGADATLRAALASGVTYFDTAPLYGYGRSELRLGHFLRNIARDGWVISTKVGRYLRPLRAIDSTDGAMTGGLPFRPVFDYSYDGVMRAFEQSQSRLGLARVDVLLIHDPDAATHGGPEGADQRFRDCMAGAVPALEELRAAGDIAAWGVGTADLDQSLRFLRNTSLDCVMSAGSYTLLDQSALAALLPECAHRNTAVLMAGPFNSGILATGAVPGAMYRYGPADESILQRTAAIQRICTAHRVPLRAAALQFPLGHPAVASVVAGASSAGMSDANAADIARAVDPALWSDLLSAGLIDARCPLPSSPQTDSRAIVGATA
jgi:D-threo-aldose 1-dehydrogenase